MGRLRLQYVPKTPCYFHYFFFAEMNIPGILWVRTRIPNERHGKTTLLRNNVSDIITHSLYKPFFRTRRNELYLWENKYMWE